MPLRFTLGDTVPTTEKAKNIFINGARIVEDSRVTVLPTAIIIIWKDPAPAVCPAASIIAANTGTQASKKPAAVLITTVTFSMHATSGCTTSTQMQRVPTRPATLLIVRS